MEKLLKIQTELKAPKNQRNSFGNYRYRSCEDILEALKPLLKEHGCELYMSDELVHIGERYYIKAQVNFFDGTKAVSVYGFAREEETKKGMDGSQITGASSSYARKYALNAMFLIDDQKDSDATNQHDDKKETTFKDEQSNRPVIDTWLSEKEFKALEKFLSSTNPEEVERGKSGFKKFSTPPLGMKKDYKAVLTDLINKLDLKVDMPIAKFEYNDEAPF